MKILIVFSVFLFFAKCSGHEQEVSGKWRSSQDEKNVISFNKNTYYNIYNNDTLDLYKYKVQDKSCDLSYMNEDLPGTFILLQDEDESCYEVTSLSDSVLAFRHTATGYLHEFEKITD